jgi:excinuclease ABC subunit A
LDVIKQTDWIIDLGPEGGDKGGTVIAKGTPETVAKEPNSYTGKFLKSCLEAAVSAAKDKSILTRA